MTNAHSTTNSLMTSTPSISTPESLVENLCFQKIRYKDSPESFLWAKRFFKDHKQALPGKQDSVYLVMERPPATNANNKQRVFVIGGLWTQTHPKQTHSAPVPATNSTSLPCAWIRSLFVCPTFRQHGVGSQLIKNVCNENTSRIPVAFVKPTLVSWYEALGFQSTQDTSWLPLSLQKKLTDYRHHQDLHFVYYPLP